MDRTVRIVALLALAAGCGEETTSTDAGPDGPIDVRLDVPADTRGDGPVDGSDDVGSVATDGTNEEVADGPADGPADSPAAGEASLPGPRKVDILFVVDNSGSMAEEQVNLSRNFPIFMDEIRQMPDLDVQIGVTSTDLGAGAATTNAQCTTAPGDDGHLCTTRGVNRCAMCGVQGPVLRLANPNFAGDLRDVFTCVARLGTTGCGLEHTLGALHQALVSPENGGFVRPDAYLAFVIITDEDDCTAPASSTLFASPIAGQDWSLRCALQGHVCGGQHPDGSTDVNHGLAECQAASDGALLPIDQLVQSVVAVKQDPRRIIATGIYGWPLPGMEPSARYTINAGGLATERVLRPVCSSANGSATPGLRVRRFVESFPNHGSYSLCQDDLREPMRLIGQKIRTSLSP